MSSAIEKPKFEKKQKCNIEDVNEEPINQWSGSNFIPIDS